MVQELREFTQSHFSSLVCEEFFNVCRHSASLNRKGQLDPVAVYHLASLGSKVMSEFERPSIPVTSVAKCTAPATLPKGFFTGEQSVCSLSDSQLGTLTKQVATWPNLSPHALKATGLQWQLSLAANGDWALMAKAWQSLLALPGSLIMKEGENHIKLVIHSSQYGFLSIRTPVSNDKQTLTPQPSAQNSVHFEYISDMKLFRCGDVRIFCPGDGPLSGAGIKIALGANKTSVFKYAALKGFRGFTVPLMKKLHRELGLPGDVQRRGFGEAMMIEILLKHALGDSYTAAKLAEAIHARVSTDWDQELVDTTGLLGVDMAEIVEEDLEDDDADVREMWAEIKRKAATRKDRAARLLQPPGVVIPGGSASSSAGAGPPARTFITRPADGYSQVQANQWCPPGARISKDDRRENRWRIRAPYLADATGGAEKSKSYGTMSLTSDFSAMVFVLSLAWRAYIRTHGGQCPYDWAE
jgi:hypothetical protein